VVLDGQFSDRADPLTVVARRAPPTARRCAACSPGLGAICANHIQPAAGLPAFTLITTPAQVQRRAFDLVGLPHRLGYTWSGSITSLRVSAGSRPAFGLIRGNFSLALPSGDCLDDSG
jgi:hypothetical protein